MADSDWWCSPPEITIPLHDMFGGPVDVDPCSNERSIVAARLALTSGGLVLPWRLARPVDRTVYKNEPYSQATAWTDKALTELASGNVREIIRLSMMSSSADWWKRWCLEPRRNPRVLCLKRVKFLDPFAATAGQKRQVCRFEPVLTYIGPHPKRFERYFKHLANWCAWGRS